MNLNKLLLFSSVLVFFAASTEDIAQSYYQLKVGNYWIYGSAMGPGRFADNRISYDHLPLSKYKSEVKEIVNINGTDYFVLENGGYLSYLSIKNDKVFLLKDVNSGVHLTYEPAMLLFDFGARSWSWNGTFSSIPCNSTGKFMGYAQLSTPEGSFTVARNRNLMVCSNGETKFYEYYFVKGVGVVGFLNFFGQESQGLVVFSLVSEHGKKN